MDDDFDLEKRLKVVELARKNGMFTFRDDDVVSESIIWFLTPFCERSAPPLNRKVRRLIRILFRMID
ncbi:MAG TPA: hypothetical protein QF644_00280 [Candidatus Poseidoniaceae archaeon]|nr:hypothetical protein [Candidatus Poseidoniaceae archaeon]